MEFISSSPTDFRRPYSYKENKPSISLNISQSISICTYEPYRNILRANNYTYRTEAYLQQREKQTINKSSTGTLKTTWKNVMQQKRILENDQAEIDRALSTIDSIHGSFNRSLLKPYSQVYSSLYGDDDKSSRLMKTFCQRKDHYTNYEVSMNNNDNDGDDDDDSNTQEISSSCDNFQDTDFDDYTEDEEEQENENEKKKSYDSGYGSVIPIRQLPRESLLKITQAFRKNLGL